MLTIQLPPDIQNRLTLLALRTGRSEVYYAREAILEHLDNIEDRFIAINRIDELDGSSKYKWLDEESDQYLDQG
ncbi:MAG: anti-toxin [Gammaproteobacteria bacterium]|jgi:RHH-type rel operon transcriptional repressor/antitoxin RelB|nr:anti-toxin [Gammaproteobacteria bacterium]MDP6094410.1 anti-toxin [Gammaproteobacteria bacterium]MDP7456159.1 anti-toxin [Gammaproteobacteria bacterium]HJO10771.1 anti-toxin [Gammaproteobacteria bacterium]|tara:strand:+ start:370 stop:591 length:222 start_codon:yes stop_codon:yes gene_type:complete